MSDYTPGPWIAVRGLAYWEVKPEQKDGGRKLPFQIADTCSSDPEDPDRGLQEANARLIAAAPDLLEALEEIVKEYCENPDNGRTLRWAIDGAKEALAKAKGE